MSQAWGAVPETGSLGLGGGKRESDIQIDKRNEGGMGSGSDSAKKKMPFIISLGGLTGGRVRKTGKKEENK